ncbi:MAG: pyrroline-5-carboxylate reductase, partial [Nitrospinota bacterium]
EYMRKSYGVATFREGAEASRGSDVVLLAVKPQQMAEALAGLKPAVNSEQLLVTIAAGVPSSFILGHLGDSYRLVRVMPNTPALVGRGAAAVARTGCATEADERLVVEMFSSVGRVVVVKEELMDAVTGLSGSGPAYAFMVLEALADGGVKMGLPRDVALTLAAQTVAGAAEMVLQTGQHPGALKDMVASPGGTTIAGLHALEAAGVRGAMMAAVEAATLRSAELGRPKGS